MDAIAILSKDSRSFSELDSSSIRHVWPIWDAFGLRASRRACYNALMPDEMTFDCPCGEKFSAPASAIQGGEAPTCPKCGAAVTRDMVGAAIGKYEQAKVDDEQSGS